MERDWLTVALPYGKLGDSMSNKLMIGAGRKRQRGWTTLDADVNTGADIIATLPPLPDAVLAQQWDEIEMIHVIEHFYLWEARELLPQLRDVLKMGGKLVIEAPNILYAARVLCGLEQPPRVAKSKQGKFDMWPLYGDPRGCNPLYGHRWGYSPETMREELIAAGFDAEKIEELPAQHHVAVRDFRIEAINTGAKPHRAIRGPFAAIAKRISTR